MRTMSGMVGQIGQNVADNLFELGKGTVKATAQAVKDIAGESIEQISGGPKGASAQTQAGGGEKTATVSQKEKEEKRAMEARRFNEVKAELERYMQWKKQKDAKVAEEEARANQEKQRETAVKKQEKESWIKKIINRAQTGTEKGRMSE